jgi:tetratricopeptide (TPR) repeat protein
MLAKKCDSSNRNNSNSIIRFIIMILLFPFLFISCLTVDKNVRYMKPAEISIPQNIKTIAVLSSGRYRDTIYDILFNVFGREDVRTRYNLIDRKNLDLILREQNLYNHDEFDDTTAVRLGELSGAQAIVLGEISNIVDKMDNGVVVLHRRFIEGYETRSNGVKIPIYKEYNESIPSIIRTYLFSIDIRMIDITKGTLIHNEHKSYKFQYENYIDNYPNATVFVENYNARFVSTFPNMEELIIKTGKDFSDYFAKKVAPYTVNERMSFEIINKDAINKDFIRFIDNDLYDEALELMLNDINDIQRIEKKEIRSMHYYNMGCVYEIKFDLEKSLEYYNKAAKDDPSDLHLEALRAIKERIEEKKKLDDQLKEKSDDQNW